MNNSFDEILKKAQAGNNFWVESAILEFTEEVLERMAQLGISKSDLAKHLGKNPSFVTKLLGGSNNFTLETMVKLSRALKSEIRIHLQPEGRVSEWLDFSAPGFVINSPNIKVGGTDPFPPSVWTEAVSSKVIAFDQPNEHVSTAA